MTILFLTAIAAVLALACVYGWLLAGRAPWIVGFVVGAGLLFCAACLLSKRLHDRGRAGWCCHNAIHH